MMSPIFSISTEILKKNLAVEYKLGTSTTAAKAIKNKQDIYVLVLYCAADRQYSLMYGLLFTSNLP